MSWLLDDAWYNLNKAHNIQSALKIAVINSVPPYSGFYMQVFQSCDWLNHNIKIRKIFNTLHFVTCVHFAIIMIK